MGIFDGLIEAVSTSNLSGLDISSRTVKKS